MAPLKCSGLCHLHGIVRWQTCLIVMRQCEGSVRAAILLGLLLWGCVPPGTPDAGSLGGGGGSIAAGGGGGSVATGEGGGAGCTTEYPSEIDDGGNVSSNWAWENPHPVGDTITGLWGASPNDVWAVANRWLIHWDGTAFAVTGSDEALHAAWGSGATNVWAVGANGTALHWDGTAWSRTLTGTNASLLAVWGSGPSDVWAVGTHSVILHWNGAAWSSRAHPSPANPTIDDAITTVWGTATSDVWAAGAREVLLHFDGTSWSAATNPLAGKYAPRPILSGAGLNDVWLVGNVWIAHWNGSSWSDQSTAANPNDPICALSGGGTNLWVATCSGTALNWDGTTWTRHYPLSNLSAIFTWSPTEVLAGAPGGAFLRGGRGISAGPTGGGGGTGGGAPSLGGGGGARGGGAGGGGAGEVTGWPRLSTGPRALLNAVWAGDGGAWAVGENGAILRSAAGPSWTSVTSNTAVSLRGVWGSAATDLWAVGGQGTVLRGDGTSWSTTDAGTRHNLNAVWGSHANDVWAVGQGGCVLHWSGTSWTRVDAGTSGELSSVWGRASNDVWAVGSLDGTVLHWDGSAWTPVATGASGNRMSKVSGTPNQLFIVGHNTLTGCGTILRFDGTSWSSVEGRWDFTSVLARGDDEVWVTGGYVHRWNGSTLSPPPRGLGYGWWSDISSDGSDLLVVTPRGQVIRIR